jgi:hypothetical protein
MKLKLRFAVCYAALVLLAIGAIIVGVRAYSSEKPPQTVSYISVIDFSTKVKASLSKRWQGIVVIHRVVCKPIRDQRLYQCIVVMQNEFHSYAAEIVIDKSLQYERYR